MKKSEKIRWIPLGGLNEIGKNISVFEYGGDAVILDCGMAFPDDDMPGVDIVIPEITYLHKIADKLRGIVLTHGHEDHIGAIPYVLKEFNLPVYGTRLTLGILKNKLAEHGILNSAKLINLEAGDTVTQSQMRLQSLFTLLQVLYCIPVILKLTQPQSTAE